MRAAEKIFQLNQLVFRVNGIFSYWFFKNRALSAKKNLKRSQDGPKKLPTHGLERYGWKQKNFFELPNMSRTFNYSKYYLHRRIADHRNFRVRPLFDLCSFRGHRHLVHLGRHLLGLYGLRQRQRVKFGLLTVIRHFKTHYFI